MTDKEAKSNKIMTNADCIRIMNDEELAEFLADTWATSSRAWQKNYAETLNWLRNAIEDAVDEIYDYGNFDYDRLRELVEADKDGRCVVLPVKEGDTVYRVSWNLFEDYPPEIFESVFHITDYYDIGNTVFLTEKDAEEAAEAAMKGAGYSKEKETNYERFFGTPEKTATL